MTKPSRSEIKRQFKHLSGAVKELLELGDADLERIEIGSDFRAEVVACRSMSGGARKRQVKYLTKLLLQEPVADVLHFLSEARGSKLEENRFFHEAELQRDAIITEALQSFEQARLNHETWDINWPSATIDTIVGQFPGLDEQEIRRVAYNYARSRNKSHYRELFRIIRSAAEKKRLMSR